MSGRPDFDLYEELQVSRNATTEVIEAAHRSLAKKHHPDVAGADPAALERTKRINIARDWLTDPELRASYDRGLPSRATFRPRRPAPPPTPGTRPPWASSRPGPSDASLGSTLAELRQLASKALLAALLIALVLGATVVTAAVILVAVVVVLMIAALVLLPRRLGARGR